MVKGAPWTIFLWSVCGGRGAARTVKYDHIYLYAYEDGWHLEKGLSDFFAFYNQRRYHRALAYRTPEAVFKADQSAENQVEKLINRSGAPVTISLFDFLVQAERYSVPTKSYLEFPTNENKSLMNLPGLFSCYKTIFSRLQNKRV